MQNTITMCIGDSITMGSSTYKGGWRRHLNNLAPGLDMVGRANVDAVNAPNGTVGNHEGYSGAQTTTFKAGGVAGDIILQIDAFRVALAIMMIGIGDIAGGATAAATLVNVLERAEAIRARATVRAVIVCNIVPLAVGDPKYDINVAFRAGLPAAVALASAGIYYCDSGAVLTNPGPDYTDSVHPAEIGYAKMAKPIYATIQAIGIQTTPTGLGSSAGSAAQMGF